MKLLKHIFIAVALCCFLPSKAQTLLFSEGFNNWSSPASPYTTSYPAFGNGTWTWTNVNANLTANAGTTGSTGCMAMNSAGNAELEFPVIARGGVSRVEITARYIANGSPAGVAANQVELYKRTTGEWVKVANIGIGLNNKPEYTTDKYTINVNDTSSNLALKLLYNSTESPAANARIHDVSIYNSGIIYTPDAPIEPWDMKAMLGRGFDVRWAEFNSDINCYSLKQVQDFAAKGFKNVRIRTNQKIPVVSEQPTEALRVLLKSRIDDALSCNLVPVLALNIDDFETTYENYNSTKPAIESNPAKITEAMTRDSIWWATLADWFKSYTHKLVFNINIEWTGAVKRDTALINKYYEVITPGIRKTNPTRILLYPPGNISDPVYLDYMRIPESAGYYVMAEWHLYAAGPGDDGNKTWTTGTAEEKQPIIDKMNAAKAWESKTNIPTWVGAWMAGNANKGNTFTAVRQADFATFMISEFTRINSPWSINANHLYYDCSANNWIDSMKVVLNVLSPLTPDSPTSLNPPYHNSYVVLGADFIQRDDTETAEIRISDLTGKLLVHDRFKSPQYRIPTETLRDGVYIISLLRPGKHPFTSKYIRKRQ